MKDKTNDAQQELFAQLLRPHFDYLYRLAYRFVGNNEGAEDLVQDLVLKLYPKYTELCQVQQLRPWLARVMYRLFVDQRRHDSRSPVQLLVDTDASLEMDQDLEQAAVGPEQAWAQQQEQARIVQAWQQLNPEQRALLAMHDIEGYTLVELAQQLKTPLGTLKSRLHRARAKLKSLLGGEPFA